MKLGHRYILMRHEDARTNVLTVMDYLKYKTRDWKDPCLASFALKVLPLLAQWVVLQQLVRHQLENAFPSHLMVVISIL